MRGMDSDEDETCGMWWEKCQDKVGGVWSGLTGRLVKKRGLPTLSHEFGVLCMLIFGEELCCC